MLDSIDFLAELVSPSSRLAFWPEVSESWAECVSLSASACQVPAAAPGLHLRDGLLVLLLPLLPVCLDLLLRLGLGLLQALGARCTVRATVVHGPCSLLRAAYQEGPCLGHRTFAGVGHDLLRLLLGR